MNYTAHFEMLLVLFPEGTTHGGPLTKAFKSGSFKIAEETQTPIIPVAIKYLNHSMFWGHESFMIHFFQKAGFCRTNVEMYFGQPKSALPCKELLGQTKASIDQQLSIYM
jgi:1-acyl-sn-glycerol-3-phosphate acyltransferase